MPKPISRYPDGASGAALLLMRISCALIAFPALGRVAAVHVTWWLAPTASTALGLALLAGIGTRLAALLLLAILIASLPAARGDIILFILGSAGVAAALALLGPGAYSIDAYRFGRRVIRLDPRSPDRGGAG